MYNVQDMKRYTVAQVRERLAAALDEAEQGIPVVIERRGVQYSLSVQSRKTRPARRRSVIETLDPVVASGQWTWNWTAEKTQFKQSPGPERR
jgi:hypothetical protein